MFKFIGALLIIVGTCVGAGMLALPLVASYMGGIASLVLLVVVWAVMFLTGLMVLECSLAFDLRRNNFSTMAKQTLGRPVQWLTSITLMLLLYSLSGAYISGSSSLLHEAFLWGAHIDLPIWLGGTIFVIFFGFFVFWSTAWVDVINRCLLSAKGFALLLVFVLLMPHINWAYLAMKPGKSHHLLAVFPVFFTAFGYHTVVPSLINYLGPKTKALKLSILIGTLIPLTLYILWLLVVLGIIPLSGAYSFQQLHHQHDSVGLLVTDLVNWSHNHKAYWAITLFANIAMTTSFLGVTLGLFDFIADSTQAKNTRQSRFKTALITFVPPLVFSFIYPQGFIMALGYAAIFVIYLEVILPVLMVKKIRRDTKYNSVYQVFGGDTLLDLVLAIGVAALIVALTQSFF